MKSAIAFKFRGFKLANRFGPSRRVVLRASIVQRGSKPAQSAKQSFGALRRPL